MALNRIILCFICVFCSSILFAETRIYLIKRTKHFPNDKYLYVTNPQEYKRFINTGQTNILKAKNQPSRITEYNISDNGLYAIWKITYDSELEKTIIDAMSKDNKIVLLSSQSINVVYDKRIGGNKTRVILNVISKLPDNFYTVFIST